jgi:biotin-[acetyl-CoA-carboxylase] ligase BirA-like protein
MRVLTDHPAAAASVITDVRPHQWQRVCDLSSSDSRLVEALDGRPMWTRVIHPGSSFWSTIVVLSESDVSQFDALVQLLGTGCVLGGPVASLAFTGGRFHGQRGRAWAAHPGNLHVSVAVPTPMDAERVGAGLSMLPAVAGVEAIMEATDDAITPRIKWVNDILVDDRKVGGVLTAAQTTNQRIENVIWGIGINLEANPLVSPNPFVPATTCLRAEPGGEEVTMSRLFWTLLDAIATRHTELVQTGASPLFSAYCRHSVVVGRAVQIWDESACAEADPAKWAPPLAEGVVAEIACDLSLRLEGRCDVINSGRLALRASSRPVGGVMN